MFKRQLLSTYLFTALCFCLSAQDSYQESIMAFQDSLNNIQLDTSTSQILAEERASFEGLNFFPINEEYIIEAALVRDHDTHVFKLTYSNEPDVPHYLSYGTLNFNFKGQFYSLHVYQNVEWVEDENKKNLLFLPFKDWTNGPESYGGGRFMHLRVLDEQESVLIDFNKSFNPPCAYNYYMACPLIPESNHIETEVFAGIKTY